MAAVSRNDALLLAIGGLPGGFGLHEDLDPPVERMRFVGRREVERPTLAQARDLYGSAMDAPCDQRSTHGLGTATRKRVVMAAGALVVGVPDEDDSRWIVAS